MWSVVLKILSILGIILLVLLGTLLAIVLLVLFMPVVYRGSGIAHAREYRAEFRFRWLFGLVRGEFAYPEEGMLRIRALWLTIYDSGKKRQEQVSQAVPEDGQGTGKNTCAAESSQDSARNANMAGRSQDSAGNADTTEVSQDSTGSVSTAEASQDSVGNEDMASPPRDSAEAEPSRFPADRSQAQESCSQRTLRAKLSALKEKLQPGLAIVRDEDNQALVRHALGRLARIIKSIRPRVLHLEALIGTGEPDTTGYMYGAYWAIKPFLGRKCRIAITPDFERQILEGAVFLRGRLVGAVLLYHIVRVILDKRLWQLIDQLKKAQDGN